MTSTMRFDKWENSLGVPYNAVVQVVGSKSTTSLSGSIGGGPDPSSTAGTLFHSFAFTPKFANSKLLLQSSTITLGETGNNNNAYYVAAYYDTTRIGISVTGQFYGQFTNNLNSGIVSLNYLFDSWGTISKTINIRVGSENAAGATSYVNNNAYSADVTVREVGFLLMEIAQ